MFPGLSRALFAMTALLAVAFSANATNCHHISDPDARACCDRNLPKSTMRQTMHLTVADDKGTVSNLGAELYWKRFDDGRARARVALTAPPRQAGTVIVLTERESDDEQALAEPEVVLYKPGERRDRLITVSALSGEMLGTDFSYEDFAHFYGTNPDVNVTRTGSEQWEGREVLVIQTTPTDAEAAFDRGSSYERIVTRFDVEQCVPVVTQFYEQDDELRKELRVTPSEIRQLGERWIPYRLVMEDFMEDSRTILSIEEIVFEEDFNDRLFSRSSLKRGR